MKLTHLFATAALALATCHAGAAVVSLNSQATYLHTNEATPTPSALALRLSDYGFSAGDRIRLEVLGDVDNGPGVDIYTFTLGLFSSSNTLLAPSQLNRVPGALASDAAPFFTVPTFFGGQATDIAEDFGFDTPAGTIVTVPNGALYLFLALYDRLYEDNSDPDGDYGVRLTRVTNDVPEPTTAALLLLGVALLGLRPWPRRPD